MMEALLPDISWKQIVVAAPGEPFWISQTPITNAQYQAFLDDQAGYVVSHWWGFSAQAASFWAGIDTPPETAAEGAALPRTNVCWYEAMAYCQWLSERTGADIRLPTDDQWQTAARGDTEWQYPWGDAFDANRCNFDSIGPSPVDQHPGGASPFGVLDLSGNVWEWCLNTYAGGIDVTLPGDRALRGGSWWTNDPTMLTCTYRSGGYPEGWSHDWGFRVVCTNGSRLGSP